MPDFIFHDDVKLDFSRIATKSPTARGRILAALEAASEDETVLNNLESKCYRTYGDNDTEIKQWILARSLGYAIHRFRFFDLEENGYRYRVIYAFDDVHDECHILAILRRDEIDYDDPANEFNTRIFAAYKGLGL